MTALDIARLTATVRPFPAVPDAVDQVSDILAGVVERRLDRELSKITVPAGDWCIRSVRTSVELNLDRPAPALERSWAHALMTELDHCLRTAVAGQTPVDPGLRHYPRRSAALGELLACSAVGDTAPAWAWVQLGLVHPSRSTDGVSRRDVLETLRREPIELIAALLDATGRIGVDALHRFLGADGWADLAAVCLTGLGANAAITEPAEPPGGTDSQRHPAVTGEPPPGIRRTGLGRHTTGGPRRIATAVAARSTLITFLRRARVQVDAVTTHSWSVLIVAESEPSALRRADARSIVLAVAGQLTGARSTGPRPAPGNGLADRSNEADRPPTSGETAHHPEPDTVGRDERGRVAPPPPTDGQGSRTSRSARSFGPSERAEPGARGDITGPLRPTPARIAPPAGDPEPAPADPEGDPRVAPPSVEPGTGLLPDHEGRGLATRWGGLFFLLNVATEAQVPDALLADPELAGRPLSWTLLRLARALLPATAADDPAQNAFAGLDPGRGSQHRDPAPVTRAESAAIERHLARWCATVAARLADPADPRELTVALAGRPGLITADRGWIEVRLPLDTVDTAVRRAGLDLDPGWLPWLGVVVRFRYE